MMGTRRAVAFGALASAARAFFACGTFTGSANPTTDGGGSLDGTSRLDAPSPTSDAGVDAGFIFPTTSFCGGQKSSLTIFCSDWDEGQPLAFGWTTASPTSGVSLMPTFDGGSLPDAVQLTNGSRLNAPTVSLANYAGRTVTIDIPVSYETVPKSVEQFVTLGFEDVASPIAVDQNGNAQCGSASGVPFGPGVHDINIAMDVSPAGKVSSFACVIDHQTNANTPVTPPPQQTLTIAISTNSNDGWTIEFDNFLVSVN